MVFLQGYCNSQAHEVNVLSSFYKIISIKIVQTQTKNWFGRGEIKRVRFHW